MEDKSSMAFILKSLLAGGVAGMCSKTTVAPFDRIKILLQAHNKQYKNHGVFSCFKQIIIQENVIALYKGNGAQMVRIFPYAAVQFTSFEMYKKYLGMLFEKSPHLVKIASGSAAGVTAVCLTYPLDVIRARLAFQVSGQHYYKGIIHAAVSIFKNEGGFKALYRGFLPTFLGMIPYAGCSFYSFDGLKYICMKYFPTLTCSPNPRNTGGLTLDVPGKLFCGGLAGALSQSLAYPFDVTRRRMQLAMMNPETRKFGSGMAKTLVLIYKENGIVRGLYRGMSINYLRSMPMVAVSFSTYELMKQILNMDTGLAVFRCDVVYPTLTYPPPPREVDGFFAPMKYHPTVLLQKHTVMNAPLASACMKCGICMVVSEKLDQILNFAMKSAISLEDFDNELSSQLLRPICDYAFHSYGLKEWEGLRFISQYPFLDNVPNSLDGRWSEILKAACHFYLNHFGEDNLVKMWLYESEINVTSLLCRNDGIFRDCSNINQGIVTIQFPSRFLFPANYVQINYACA